MSVQSEIDRINGNVANTYSALSEMGATMPEQQNSDNLAQTARTVPVGGASVQSDWNQADESAADFIKNKPFYKNTSIAELLPYTQLMYDGDSAMFIAEFSATINEGAEYSVNYNGTIYPCTAKNVMGMYSAFGNLKDYGEADTGEPFCILIIPEIGVLGVTPYDNAAEVSLSLTGEITTIKKMDAEYAPHIVFYCGDDIYLYNDAALTKKTTIGDVKKANATGAPLYLCRYGGEFSLVTSVFYPVGVDSNGVGYLYAEMLIPTASEGVGKVSLFYSAYCTAEYAPE